MKSNRIGAPRRRLAPAVVRTALKTVALTAATLAVEALALPGTAQACGGLVCDNAQPVVQAAERIAFVRDGATLHMVVRLTYQGPPIDFGWLLPVPPDVQTRVGSVALFNDLDAQLTPRFALQTELDPNCAQVQFNGDAAVAADAQFADGGAGGGPDVQVLSREQVGPYDQVVLLPATVADLRTWLDDNDYSFPEGADDLLQGYLDAGSAFLALKLVADADDTDVVPLHLSFTGDTPAIPLRPTAMAAQPDMGILVHLWGRSRAVPINYNHVQINEAAINWLSGGGNYPDVVSQAADEAGGRAFVTDAALADAPISAREIPSASLDAIAAATTLGEVFGNDLSLFSDTDVARVLARHVDPPGDQAAADYLSCLGCFGGDWQALPVDGAALAAELRTEVAESRALLGPLFAGQPFITRLYTTMSAAEMDVDPIFDFNPDLPEVSPQHLATQYITCVDGGDLDFSNPIIITADGQRTPAGAGAPAFIQRQNGLTVRGEDTTAAAVVERMFAAGQPEVISEYTPTTGPGATPSGALGGSSGGDGCDCAVGPGGEGGAPGGAPLMSFATLLALLGLRRRRPR